MLDSVWIDWPGWSFRRCCWRVDLPGFLFAVSHAAGDGFARLSFS
jgi:hypothetical protein